MCTNRVDESCNGLEDQPLRVDLECVLVCSLDTVEHWLLVAIHGGILQMKDWVIWAINLINTQNSETD